MPTHDGLTSRMLKPSVIIPTYNRADYLPQALKSVFDQSLSPFEVIVVDDGSSDGTADLVRAFRPAVRYLWQDHKGVSAARNLGLDEARGEVIAWLDTDDLWEPDFLATMIPRLAEDQKLDGVYSGCTHIDAAGNTLPQFSHRVVSPTDLYSSLIEGNFIATPAIIVRKERFDQVGWFDLQLGICEDYDMWLRLAKNSNIAGLPDALVRIRVHDSNTVQDTAAFSRFRLALVEKHFGSLEGDPATWIQDKRRACGYAYREVALRHNQGDQVAQKWRSLERAIVIWPDLLGRLDTFYELACSEQSRGHRGHAASLDIEKSGAEILGWLDSLFAGAVLTLEPMRRPAYSNAYTALAMLSDQAGRWTAARQYLLRAIRANPRLAGSPPVVRRLLKLYGGQRLANIGRNLRQEDQGSVPDIV